MIFGKHINKYYLKYSYMLLLGLAALVVVDYYQLIIPELYRLVINGINNGSVMYGGELVAFDLDFLLDNVCLPMIEVIICLVIGRFIWRICFFGSAILVETDIRGKMFDHAKDLSQEYYQKNKVGGMMSLFTNDLETVQDCFGSGVLMFFDAAFLGGLSIAKMWQMNVTLTLFSLIPVSCLVIGGLLVSKTITKKWARRQEAFSSLSDFAQESFSGIAVIKAFVKEWRELMAFRKLNRENEDANVDFTKTSTILNILVTLFVESVICVILGYGGYLVYNGVFDAGELVEFIGYFSSVVWPAMAVSQLIEMGSRGKASLNRIGELLDAEITVCDRDGVSELENVRGDIEFKDLTFRYPDGEYDVLKNLSFRINAGEHVGLVGKTGSGKTTVVDLILRTYNVPDGTLFIDGRDVNDVSVGSVRGACAYVPQDNFLYSDTIRRNIAFTADDPNTVSFESIKNAAVLAGIHDNIEELGGGYETMLGERGVTVSGGQKQRISIARALLPDSPILILDDSVSAVDTKTEEVILRNLRECRADKTTILIAHRISTVERMDKIVFIDDGRLAAVGTHRELYETNAEYRHMVDLQLLDDDGVVPSVGDVGEVTDNA